MSEPEEIDVAQAMGFGSFGMQKASTKRAYTDDHFSSTAPAKVTPPPSKSQKVMEEDKRPKQKQNEMGDDIYFMPSFIEDPWKDLVDGGDKVLNSATGLGN
ncbi:hypothetical protein K470DRAFT_277716 [Piedraia hortae CBS 480.64]|uniref:Uncharacterized protein n=1 Tax=Piedraia hortae CBS 480.64 TaxID=1314780 RepID=A0A6A7BWE6_9PEZI|nr:hypothetical protein K470DRAFT_277716 [Piedraia hortae CBS 480.64]